MSGGLAAPPGDEAGGAGYSRLSLLAVASFGLGALTSVGLALGFAVALLRDVSFLLPSSYLAIGLIPLGGLICGWISLRSIEAAEGALSGRMLARAGLWASLGCMLVYGAYHGATLMAIQMRAEGFARMWLDLIAGRKPEDLDTAFVYTLVPGSRPSLDGDRSHARAKLEIEYNQPGELTGVGPYSTFTSSPLVQLLQLSSAKPVAVLRRVSEPNFVDNGYEMALEFDIETPEARFRLAAVIHAAMSNSLAPIRKWQVRQQAISSASGRDLPELLGPGKAHMLRVDMARRAAMEFSESLDPRKRDFPRAYSLTIPGSRIPRVKPDDAAMAGFLRGINGADGSGFVTAKPPVFWASPEVRDDFMTYLKAALDPDYLGPGFQWFAIPATPTFPAIEVAEGRARVRFPVKLMMLPRYVGAAELELSAPPDRADRREAWLVEKLVLTSARLAPQSPELKNAPPDAMNAFLRKR